MPKKKTTKPEAKETAEKKENTSAEKTEEVKEEKKDSCSDSDYEKLKKEYDTQKDQFLRMAAEYDNFRKRTEKEKLATYDNAVAATVEAFLPVVDNFALAMASSADVSDEFKKGLELIEQKLQNALKQLNVTEFGERGEEFNPEFHNAIARTDDDELEEDHIVQVYQKGYKIGDKIIRHAMVQVSN
ncbi:MAG: nucleotide exchange factor GrpE [Acutalibacteraceae bacterium]